MSYDFGQAVQITNQCETLRLQDHCQQE